ncbi:MAG: T9SS type A sorting domain-containing protein, partial [Candidatus Cloacimonetes bacterium]|nr:T9SS type A sorting domain-containing protein [Candidatus Cloacimonadota bacterium]
AVSLAPSPFASSTTLNYRSAKAQKVLISVYDLRGRLICREECQALQGINSWTWDARIADPSSLASGVCLIRISNGRQASTIKGVLIK